MTRLRLKRFGTQQPPSGFGSTYPAPDSPVFLQYILRGPHSLKNHGVDAEVDHMFSMGAETMSLPLSEKMTFEQGDKGISFGYKASGANAVDELGNLDTVEFINISQDDVFAWPNTAHRTYPRTVNERMDNTIIPFVRKSRGINAALLGILERKMGLPEGELLEKHSEEELSGSETRCIKSPPRPPGDNGTTAIGAHTDFGSLVSTTVPLPAY
jgi:isopenicillin N synthase-like dioxygenase